MTNIYVKDNSIDLTHFESDDTEFKVNFDSSLKYDDIVEVLNKVFDWEEQSTFNKNIHIDLKGLSTDLLVELYKYLFNRKTLINNSVIANISILINGYNTLDDSLFESPVIYESDLEQLLDVKLGLITEIKEFQQDVSMWYLACLKSMHKVEYTYLDTVVEMPSIYKKIISSSNLLTLSQIFSKAGPIDTENLPLVKHAYPTIMSIASVSAVADILVKKISGS